MNLKVIIENFDAFHQEYKTFKESIEQKSELFLDQEDLITELDEVMQSLKLHIESLNATSDLGVCDGCGQFLQWDDDIFCKKCDGFKE